MLWEEVGVTGPGTPVVLGLYCGSGGLVLARPLVWWINYKLVEEGGRYINTGAGSMELMVDIGSLTSTFICCVLNLVLQYWIPRSLAVVVVITPIRT